LAQSQVSAIPASDIVESSVEMTLEAQQVSVCDDLVLEDVCVSSRPRNRIDRQ
jgi:hypothetical protein